MSAKLAPMTVYLSNEDAVHNLETGQRLSTVRWRLTDKAKKEGKQERHPVIVSVPACKVKAPSDWCLFAAMQTALNEMQDAMVTEAVNAAIAENSAVKLVGMVLDLDMSESGIAAWHASKQVNGKLSGDAIKAWFTENVADNLGMALIEAGVIGEKDEAKLAAILADFQAKFIKLASPKANMPEALVKQMQRALNTAPDDKIKAVLAARLQGFLKPAEEALNIAF
jgi:hypothetical protein